VASNNGTAEVFFGNGNLASVVNTGSGVDFAFAGGTGPADLGNNNIAYVLGTDSTAAAGSSMTTPGDFDLAAVFGDMLHALATGVSNMVDILPSL
jgi:hypothetical protein